MCQKLRDTADKELKHAQLEHANNYNEAPKKRAGDAAELDGQGGSWKRSAESTPYEGFVCQALDFVSAEPNLPNTAAVPEPLSGSAQLLPSLGFPAVDANTTTNCWVDGRADMVLPQTIGNAATLDDLELDAPVNWVVNFPDYTGVWTATTE